jgi:hypothetical protein
MRYRRLDENGDMTFGQGQGNFWINQPEGVAQLALTRLRLDLGAWFYDMSDGTAWKTEVLGERTQGTRDIIVIDRVRGTDGVVQIDTYGSRMNPDTREWAAAMRVSTIYGPIEVVAPRLPGAVPPLVEQAGAAPTAATELGLLGGTPLTMTPADLVTVPSPNITDLSILRLEAGTW